jgi:Asp-tRNA(Asn)/Glu-tRNA(Gln) amidotransferase A subunit family amidase
MDFDHLDIDDDIVRNTHDAVKRLRSLGAEVVEVGLNFPAGIEQAYNAHMVRCFAGPALKLEEFGDQICIQ